MNECSEQCQQTCYVSVKLQTRNKSFVKSKSPCYIYPWQVLTVTDSHDCSDRQCRQIIMFTLESSSVEMTQDERWEFPRPFHCLVRHPFSRIFGHSSCFPSTAECDQFRVTFQTFGVFTQHFTYCVFQHLFQNGWTEAVDAGGCGGTPGANGDGGWRSQSREARWL